MRLGYAEQAFVICRAAPDDAVFWAFLAFGTAHLRSMPPAIGDVVLQQAAIYRAQRWHLVPPSSPSTTWVTGTRRLAAFGRR